MPVSVRSIDTDIRRKMYLYSACVRQEYDPKIGNGLSVFCADQIFETIRLNRGRLLPFALPPSRPDV